MRAVIEGIEFSQTALCSKQCWWTAGSLRTRRAVKHRRDFRHRQSTIDNLVWLPESCDRTLIPLLKHSSFWLFRIITYRDHRSLLLHGASSMGWFLSSNTLDSLLNGFTRLSELMVQGLSYFFQVSPALTWKKRSRPRPNQGLSLKSCSNFVRTYCSSTAKLKSLSEIQIRYTITRCKYLDRHVIKDGS